MDNFISSHSKFLVVNSDSDSAIRAEVVLASKNPKKRAGRIKFQETRHPIFRGVRKRASGKWVCEVREPNKKTRIWLGTYETADMAARARDVAAIALRGRSACLNFADSTWRLPVPASSDVADIQRAAAEAAEMFVPMQNEDVAVEDNAQLDVPEDHDFFGTDDVEHLSMEELLAGMAEGLMVPPPLCGRGYDDVEINVDVSLWSFSMD